MMGKNIRTARGDIVDFDTIMIKQQLAQAPMNIEVERRKNFIDSKEGKVRGARVAPPVVAAPQPTAVEVTTPVKEEDFLDNQPVVKGTPIEAIPDIPDRKKK